MKESWPDTIEVSSKRSFTRTFTAYLMQRAPVLAVSQMARRWIASPDTWSVQAVAFNQWDRIPRRSYGGLVQLVHHVVAGLAPHVVRSVVALLLGVLTKGFVDICPVLSALVSRLFWRLTCSLGPRAESTGMEHLHRDLSHVFRPSTHTTTFSAALRISSSVFLLVSSSEIAKSLHDHALNLRRFVTTVENKIFAPSQDF